MPSATPRLGQVRLLYTSSGLQEGKDLYACSDIITPAKVAQTLSQLSGKQYTTGHVSRDEFMQLKDKMDYELWLNYLAFVNGYVCT